MLAHLFPDHKNVHYIIPQMADRYGLVSEYPLFACMEVYKRMASLFFGILGLHTFDFFSFSAWHS